MDSVRGIALGRFNSLSPLCPCELCELCNVPLSSASSSGNDVSLLGAPVTLIRQPRLNSSGLASYFSLVFCLSPRQQILRQGLSFCASCLHKVQCGAVGRCLCWDVAMGVVSLLLPNTLQHLNSDFCSHRNSYVKQR